MEGDPLWRQSLRRMNERIWPWPLDSICRSEEALDLQQFSSVRRHCFCPVLPAGWSPVGAVPNAFRALEPLLSAAPIRQQPDHAQHYTLSNERHHQSHVAQARDGHIRQVDEHRLVGDLV